MTSSVDCLLRDGLFFDVRAIITWLNHVCQRKPPVCRHVERHSENSFPRQVVCSRHKLVKTTSHCHSLTKNKTRQQTSAAHRKPGPQVPPGRRAGSKNPSSLFFVTTLPDTNRNRLYWTNEPAAYNHHRTLSPSIFQPFNRGFPASMKSSGRNRGKSSKLSFSFLPRYPFEICDNEQFLLDNPDVDESGFRYTN